MKRTLVKSDSRGEVGHSSGKFPNKKSKTTPNYKKKLGNDEKNDPKPKPSSKLSITFPEEGKPEWKKIKEQSKCLTKNRKLKKNASLFRTIHEAKQKFEILRNSKLANKDREKLIAEILKLLKGNLSKVSKSHDMGRVVQWLLKLGTPEVREAIVDELISDIVSLSQCKYSSFLVGCIMRTCDSQTRRKIISKCKGSIVKLLSNKLSSPVIEDIYAHYTSLSEKNEMRMELYGELYKSLCTHSNNKSYSQILEENANFKGAVLQATKIILLKLLPKKWTLYSTLYLSALYEFLSLCDSKDENDFLEAVKSRMPVVIRTKEGAHVASIAIFKATTKEKKDIVKELKGDLVNIAMSEGGSFFLMTLIDSVDDTVLMKKALLPSVIESADSMIKNDHGIKVIMYLAAHRGRTFFHPSLIEKLKHSDDSQFVKKSNEQRIQELKAVCTPALLSKINDEPALWFSTGAISLLTVNILKDGSGDKLRKVFTGIAAYITSTDVSSENVAPKNIIEVGHIHAAVKKIISHDQEIFEREQRSFCIILVETIDNDMLKQWCAINRGCFTLECILKSGVEPAVAELKKRLTDIDVKKIIKKNPSKGGGILLGMI